MKEYFFLTGKDQNGPFTIEQLEGKDLTNETLIWTEGLDNWQKLKDIPELVQIIKPKSVPPPPPPDTHENISKTEISGQLKVTTERAPNPALEAITASKTDLTWLIVWCVFHLFALLMSYSEVSIFNDGGKPRTDKFWPFVEFSHKDYDRFEASHNNQYVELDIFDGFFVEYDWTEFSFYFGGAIVIFLLVRISNKSNESNQ